MPEPVRSRPSRKALVRAFAVPAAIALASSLLMRPELPTLITPVLGPWAGHALGHASCTLATCAPELTAGVVALGVAVAAALAFLRVPAARILLPALAAIWAVAWTGLAFLSVVNASF